MVVGILLKLAVMIRERRISVFALVALGLLLTLFWCVWYRYHFYFREQYSVFLGCGEFVREMLREGVYCGRGWMAEVAGGWLTQFYYYVGVGPVIVGLVLVLLGLGVSWMLWRVGVRWWLCLCVGGGVMLWEWGRECVGLYPLSSSLSLLFGVGMGCCYGLCGGRLWLRWVVGLVVVGLCVWGVGYGGVVCVGYVVVSEVRRGGWGLACVGLLGCGFVGYGGFAGGVWWGWPSMGDEGVIRVDCKGWWGRRVSEGEYGEGMRDRVIANCLYTLQEVRDKGDRALDGVDWGCLQLFIPVNESGSYMTITTAGEVWYELGDMTMAEHATMLGMIFSPRRSGSRHLMRLAELNIIRGDEAAAEKYLRMLRRSVVHRGWAERRMVGRRSLGYEEWLEGRRRLLQRCDTLRATGDYGRSLRNLLESDSGNVMARTYLLAWDMQNRLVGDFARDYARYGGGVMTRAYGEALMVVAATAPVEVKRLLEGVAVPEGVVRDFGRFNELMERGDVGALRREFGKSYWWYCQGGR